MFQRISAGLPSVFQAIASPQCDPSPRPFEGDPYAAALPLFDRLEEILGAYKDTDSSAKSHRLRERILNLAWRVPERHNTLFNGIVGHAQEMFDSMAPPVVKMKKFDENAPCHVIGIGIRGRWDDRDIERCTLELIAPIISAVKENEGREIICWKFPRDIGQPLLNQPYGLAHFGELEVCFRATEEAGFLSNQFCIAAMVSSDVLPDNNRYRIDWKHLPERWD